MKKRTSHKGHKGHGLVTYARNWRLTLTLAGGLSRDSYNSFVFNVLCLEFDTSSSP